MGGIGKIAGVPALLDESPVLPGPRFARAPFSGRVLVHIVRSFLIVFGFAAIFFGLTLMGALMTSAVRGQF